MLKQQVTSLHLAAAALAVLLVGAGLSAGADAAVIEYTDGEFAAGNWQDLMIVGDPAAFTSAQELTGGSPGAWRHIVWDWDGTGIMAVGSRLSGATYEPAIAGAIDHVDFSIDAVNFSGAEASGITLLAVQSGNWYVTDWTLVSADTWQTFTLSGLTTADFHDPGNVGHVIDFSGTGSLIEFGLMFGLNDGSFAGFPVLAGTDYGVDDYRVAITQVPEPGTLACLAIAGVAVLCWRRT